MSRIIISVSNDLKADQRVAKISQTLKNQGYEILLVGRLLKDRSELDRPYKTKRLKLLFNKGPMFYAELNFRLFFLLLFSKADIFLSNDLDTLLPNFICAKLRSKKLVYDSHEYFTEVPELKGRTAKKIWENLEKVLFPRLRNVYTVGPKLAEIYSNKYGVSVKTIKNVPLEQPAEKNERSFLLYQGALNVGRGIPELIKAVKETNYTLKIAGSGDITEEIRHLINELKLEKRVELLGRLDPLELKKLTAKAFISFNLLDANSLNYYYSLANKFFDAIQARVPIITMNFPEYRNVYKKFKVGVLVDDLEKKTLLEAIKEIEANTAFYENELDRAAKIFNWEKESEKLKSIFANLE